MSTEQDRQPSADDVAGHEASEPENVLSRWSRRKAEARRGIEPPEGEPAQEVGGPDERPPAVVDDTVADAVQAAEETTEQAPDPAPELPPIDTLGEDSDYSPFLSAGVSEDMQREALRKLFHSPKFNVRDGLDDYDLDFSNPRPLGNVITAEMRHRVLKELERLARSEVPDEERERAALTAAAAPPDEHAEDNDTPDSTRPDEDLGENPGEDDGRTEIT
ncbi:MAG: DUF3306 domain-containing protein [Gammaproteobacteria bacterium]|jgi:hypothetical protein